MTQSSHLENNDKDELPIQAPIKRSVSVQLIKIDCDCSRGRGNFDEGNDNDYDNLPKDDRKRDDRPRNRQQRNRPAFVNSSSMEQIDPFRYTPGKSDEQTQPSIFSPKRTSSTQNNNSKQANQNDKRSVIFGGKAVEDHKSGQNKRRGQNQDYSYNYNRNSGNKNRRKGVTRSNSLVIGSRLQNQDQPSTPQPQQQQQVYQPHTSAPLTPQSSSNNNSKISSQSSTPVSDWKPFSTKK